MLSGAVEGRLLGIDTLYFDTQLVSFKRNSLFPFSRWAHVYLRDAGSVVLQNVATNLPNKTAFAPKGR